MPCCPRRRILLKRWCNSKTTGEDRDYMEESELLRTKVSWAPNFWNVANQRSWHRNACRSKEFRLFHHPPLSEKNTSFFANVALLLLPGLDFPHESPPKDSWLSTEDFLGTATRHRRARLVFTTLKAHENLDFCQSHGIFDERFSSDSWQDSVGVTFKNSGANEWHDLRCPLNGRPAV